ncbi:MAG: hypothetical protein IJ335_02500 [Lachnospiraceae bacterium]|nr:hypothetical protein [Lachnospiraceae bacterium]
MWEMIKHAWEGWLAMNLSGKYSALLILVLAYLWIGKMGYTIREEQKRILLYATVLVPLCICPLTAAVLMGYQTKFFDYPWIWSLVPVTALIAMGGTIVLIRMKEELGLVKQWQQVTFVAVLIGVLWLSGGLGSQERRLLEEKTAYQDAELILGELQGESRELCIWGPTTVQEYVRIIDSRVRVPYGRNMWDESLNAYFYDTYDEETIRLYKAMDYAQHHAHFENREVLNLAIEKGVTHLILPGYVAREDVEAVAGGLGSEIKQLQGYFVITVQ